MQIYHLAEDTESKTVKSFYSNLGKLANVTKTERILINEIYCKKKMMTTVQCNLYYSNPFAPEPPVTSRVDPGPFYPL